MAPAPEQLSIYLDMFSESLLLSLQTFLTIPKLSKNPTRKNNPTNKRLTHLMFFLRVSPRALSATRVFLHAGAGALPVCARAPVRTNGNAEEPQMRKAPF